MMVVDDEPGMVSMLCDIMKLSGYSCVGFSSASMALEDFRLHSERYAVVITDLTMPGLKGDAFAEQIKQINPHCLVIVSTGYHPDLVNKNFAPYVLLQKPYQIDTLLEMIHEKT